MTKKTFGKICVWLLLAIGFVCVSVRSASAGFTDANSEMAAACDSYGKNMADYQGAGNCYSCQIFMLIFNSSNAVAGQINKTLAKPMMGLVGMGGGLWLAFITLAFFGNLSDGNGMEYLTNVGKIIFRVGIAGAFLAGGSSLAFEYIVNPVLADGASLAFGGSSGSGGGSVSAGPMNSSVGSSLNSMIEGLSTSMAKSQAIAQGLRCGSVFWRKMEFGFPISKILDTGMLIPNPLMWAVGAFLGCVFWVISIMFCFAMMDVIFRICLLVGILPIFIAAWVFPLTASLTKSAWDMFLNSVIVFFITGIIAKFVQILSDVAWGSSSAGFGTFMGKMQSSAYVEAWDSLFDEGAGTGFMTLLTAMVLAMWGWAMSPKGDTFGSQILGGSFSSSVAVKAVHAIFGFVIDIISTVFTIITAGIGACMYLLKAARFILKAMEMAKKIEEGMKKIEKIQKKIREAQKKAEKLKKVLRAAQSAVPKG